MAAVVEVSGKEMHVKHVDGPVGVHSRNFSNARIYSLGWQARVSLRGGIEWVYAWIEKQVKAALETAEDEETAARVMTHS